MKITFDAVHTQKKQLLLKEMMEQVTYKILQLPNKNKVLTNCPICGGNVNFFVEAYGFNMSQCIECELIFCNPYPTEEQLNYYYNSEMKQFENEFFKDSFEQRINLFLPRIELIKKYKKKGSLLDIGSAIGIFIEALQRSNVEFEVTCCDLSQHACNELKTRYPKYKVINDNFLNLSNTLNYDVITMWDTIEHIVKLDELIKGVKNILKKDGVFVFSTPNTKSFEWDIARENHVQLLPPGHVNLMNEKNISLLLQKHDMEIIGAYTLNASLDIGYIKKLIENNEVNNERIGTYLKDKLYEKSFEQEFEKYLISTRQAGNIIIITRHKNVNI